jgi:hypothetical protein
LTQKIERIENLGDGQASAERNNMSRFDQKMIIKSKRE